MELLRIKDYQSQPVSILQKKFPSGDPYGHEQERQSVCLIGDSYINDDFH